MVKRTRFLLPISVLFTLWGLNALAAEQCTNPRSGFPSITFSMTGLGDGLCEKQLDRARWIGFTSVTLSPTFFFNQKDSSVSPKENPGVLESCLDQANRMGFDVVYKPMIDVVPKSETSLPKTNSKIITLEDRLLQVGDPSKNTWRAWLGFHPGYDYQQKVMEPFLHWIESNNVKGTALKASIVVATELHRSLTDYPKEWNDLMWGMRKRLENDGLRSQVQIGIDPIVFGKDAWLPSEIKKAITKSECDQYQAMLWTADFFAPSVYGDYLENGFKSNPGDSVGKLIESVRKNYWLRSLTSRGCKVGQSLINRFISAQNQPGGRDQGRSTNVTWTGETGFAGSLSRSYAGFENDPPYQGTEADWNYYENNVLKNEQANFQKNAPIWLKAVLDHARGSNQDTINLWTTGRFDLYGFSDLPPLGDLNSTEGQYTNVDPVRGADAIPAVAEIRDLLQSYTRERCPGWEPLYPVKKVNAPAQVLRHRRKRKRKHLRPQTTESITVNAGTSEPLELEKVDSEGVTHTISEEPESAGSAGESDNAHLVEPETSN